MKFFSVSLLPIGSGKEKKTFEILKKLSDTVVRSVEKFEEGVKTYSDKKFDEGEKYLREVDRLESKADKYGMEFESKLREGAFLPAFRGDLSRLAESIDDVSDRAEESMREIHRRPRVFEDLTKAEEKNEEAESIRLGLVDLAGKAVASARIANKAVSILLEDMDEAAERAEEIHRRERESDTQEDELAVNLYKHEDLLNPTTVMQVKGLIERFGSISDAAEDSGDIISAMTISMRG